MLVDHPAAYFLEIDPRRGRDRRSPSGDASPAPLESAVRCGVREVTGVEGISRPFRFELSFVDTSGLLDPDRIVGLPCALVIERDERARTVPGVITRAGRRANLLGPADLRVVVEPRLALARLRSDLRVFRNQSAPEIVTEVLAAIGVSPELRLSATYATRPYCVQYRETDFDFVSRLLEDEGIFYFFLEDGALVLGDSPAAYEPIAGESVVPFRPGAGLAVTEEALHRVGRRSRLMSEKVTLRDFDPARPSASLEVQAKTPAPSQLASGGEFYDYPGEYQDTADGARKARARAESFACEGRDVLVGSGRCTRFFPGSVFTLTDAPPEVADGSYAVTKLEHRFHASDTPFSTTLEALSAEVGFRPRFLTPEPVIETPVTAIVTGPAGEDIHTDAIGRVKVRFHWDRRLPYDDNASDWVPVLQDNTGHSMAIPRIGWEVAVQYLEGDPDRPVVLGRVYNGADTFPEALPANKTRSALQSLSSPGRDGTNLIRFEDAAGAEQVFVHAEKDQNVVVVNDKRESVLSDEGVATLRDESVRVGSNAVVDVGADMIASVGSDQVYAVGASRSRQVDGGDTSTVGGNHFLTIGASHSRRIGTDDVVSAKNLKEQVGALILEASLKTNATSAGIAMATTVGGAVVEVARKSKSESARGRNEIIGGLFLARAGGSISASTKKSHVVTVGGALKVSAAKAVGLTAGTSLTMMAPKGAFTGATSVTLQVGNSSVILSDGLVQMKSGEILIQIKTNSQGATKSSQA
jgi:type VI secretion system secreted protein VgrG